MPRLYVGVGVIWFQADGFLELADRLVGLAFLVEGDAEVVVGEVVVLRDFKRMPEQGFTVLPITHLLPRQRQGRGRSPPPPATDNAGRLIRQPRVSSSRPRPARISNPRDGR